GSALVMNGIVEPMELAHLPYRKGVFEDYVGVRALEKNGKKKWRRDVQDVVARLIAALEHDEVVLGGGNVRELKEMPPRCRAGNNANAFLGGFQLWEKEHNDGSTRRSSRQYPGSRTSGLEGTRSSVQESQQTASPKIVRRRHSFSENWICAFGPSTARF